MSATVDTALDARVKSLALFHHDPMHADDAVARMVATAERRVAERGSTLKVFAAKEGLTLELGTDG